MPQELIEIARAIGPILGRVAYGQISPRIRRSLTGPPVQAAIDETYGAALQSFIEFLASDSELDASDIRSFFGDEEVQFELGGLITPQADFEIDLEYFQRRRQSLGVFGANVADDQFAEAIHEFASMFVEEASERQELQPILTRRHLSVLETAVSRLSIQLGVADEARKKDSIRLENVESMVTKIYERSRFEISHSQIAEITPSLDRTPVEAATSPSVDNREFEYDTPTQKHLRYLILAFDSTAPTNFVVAYRMLAATRPNWTERWSDTIELVLTAEEFAFATQFFSRWQSRINESGTTTQAERFALLVDEAARELDKSIREIQSGKTLREPDPRAAQMRKAGQAYVVLGLAPWAARLYELGRTLLHPLGQARPERNGTEIIFESYEDARFAVETGNRILVEESQNKERSLARLQQELIKRFVEKSELMISDFSN